MDTAASSPKSSPNSLPTSPSRPQINLTEHLKRAQAAWQEQQEVQSILEACYKYVMPFRQSSKNTSNNQAKSVELTDITAQTALMRSAGQFANDLCPPDQKWGDLEPGILLQGEADYNEARLLLQHEAAKIRPIFMDGAWSIALNEMCQDLQVGTGAMLIVEKKTPPYVNFITPAIEEIALEQGAHGTLVGVFYRRSYTVRQIAALYPEGMFDDVFKTKLQETPEEKLELNQDTLWHEQKQIWETFAYLKNAKETLHSSSSYTCPWLVSRYWKMPNEVWGRGPAQLALPSVKTLNKTLEITLMAAALATLGIYTIADDGVLNTDTLRIQPGAMWFVQNNGGGARGRSIERLETPGKFDISNLILEELRKQIREAFMDATPQEKDGNPRSATEIVQRFKNIAQSKQGVYGRAIQEILIPAWRRVAEILYNKNILAQKYSFDQLLVQVKITSPIAQSFRASAVQPMVEYLQIAAGMMPPQELDVLIDKSEMMQDIGFAMGVEAKYIRTKEERERIQAVVQKMVQAALQQAAQQQMQQAAAAQGLPNAQTPSMDVAPVPQ